MSSKMANKILEDTHTNNKEVYRAPSQYSQKARACKHEVREEGDTPLAKQPLQNTS